MPRDGLNFSDFAWTFKWLQSEHLEINT